MGEETRETTFTIKAEWAFGMISLIIGFLIVSLINQEGRISKIEAAVCAIPKIESVVTEMSRTLNLHYDREAKRDK